MQRKTKTAWVADQLVETAWYLGDDIQDLDIRPDDPTMKELQEALTLAHEAGLTNEVKRIEGDIAYIEYLKREDTDPERDYGAKLTGEQMLILLDQFNTVFQWGHHARHGDLVEYHAREYGNDDGSWRWTSTDEQSISFRVRPWHAYNHERIPLDVLRSIKRLQEDPQVQVVYLMTPREEHEPDPVLVANCHRLGNRLVARWGEALENIEGIDEPLSEPAQGSDPSDTETAAKKRRWFG